MANGARVGDLNHGRFLKHLDESQVGVWTVAQWLASKGYAVTVTPSSRAPTHGDWKQHADNGDLQITQRVEVKRLSREFTGRDDWPFKDKFIVCAKHAWDSAQPKPYAYVILSASMRHAGIVKGDSRDTWYVEPRTDRRYDGVRQDCYFAPLSVVAFTRIGVE